MDGRNSATSVPGWLGWLVRHCGVARYVCGRRGPVSKGASATVTCCCRWVAFSIRLWIKSTVSRISRIFATRMTQASGACGKTQRGPRAARAGHGPRGPRRSGGGGGTWCFAVGRGGKGSRLPPLLWLLVCRWVRGFRRSYRGSPRWRTCGSGGRREGSGAVLGGGCEARGMAGPTLACRS